MEIRLTNAAKNSIALIYSQYMKRMKSGMSKSAAIYFCENDSFIKTIARENLSELAKAKLIEFYIYGDVLLLNDGIIFMESLPADTFKEWISIFK